MIAVAKPEENTFSVIRRGECALGDFIPLVVFFFAIFLDELIFIHLKKILLGSRSEMLLLLFILVLQHFSQSQRRVSSLDPGSNVNRVHRSSKVGGGRDAPPR